MLIFDACESAAARQTVMFQLEHATGAPIISAAPEGKAAYESNRLGHGVLTYAILEALHRPSSAAAEPEPVTVWSIATHIGRQVPALSQREFGIRQIPHFTPGTTKAGSEDFPIGHRASVLSNAPIVIPTMPTHVNTQVLKVFKRPDEKGLVIYELPYPAVVSVIDTKRGWAKIAVDGKPPGYVPESS